MNNKVVLFGGRLSQAIIAFFSSWLNGVGLSLVHGFGHSLLDMSRSCMAISAWGMRMILFFSWMVRTAINLMAYPMVLAWIVARVVLKNGGLRGVILNNKGVLNCVIQVKWLAYFSVHRWVVLMLKNREVNVGMPLSTMTSRLKSGNDEVDFKSVVYSGFGRSKIK
jgi:hypothetical protein